MKAAFALILAAAFLPAIAQEPYKCKTPAGMVYQDRPCKVLAPTKAAAAPVELATAASAVPEVSEQQARLAKDKAWLAERAAKRAEDESNDRINHCEQDAYAIQAEIDRTAATPNTAMGGSTQGLLAMQLETERRQTTIAGLQSRVTARRHECDGLRKTHDRKYRK